MARDLTAGLVVFLVALPSCLEIALVQQAVDPLVCQRLEQLSDAERKAFIDATARENVARVTESILRQSEILQSLHQFGRVAIIGAIYDVATGDLEFLPHVDGCVGAPDAALLSAKPGPAPPPEAV